MGSRGCTIRLALIILCAVPVIGLAGALSHGADVANNFLPVTVVLIAVLGTIAFVKRHGTRISTLILCTVGISAGALPVIREFVRVIPQASVTTVPTLSVMTANVWVDNRDVDLTVDSINRSGADIVLLQETHGTFQRGLPQLAAVYPFRSRCKVAICQLTILSKTPFLASKYRLRDRANKPYGPKLFWMKLIARDGQPVTVISVHYPWPLPDDAQAKMRGEVARAIVTLDTDNLIVAGDMNLTPWTAAMRAQDEAFAPLIRRTRGIATWPAMIATANTLPFLAIDQIYAGKGWTTITTRRMERTGSDHYPLFATFTRAHRNENMH